MQTEGSGVQYDKRKMPQLLYVSGGGDPHCLLSDDAFLGAILQEDRVSVGVERFSNEMAIKGILNQRQYRSEPFTDVVHACLKGR